MPVARRKPTAAAEDYIADEDIANDDLDEDLAEERDEEAALDDDDEDTVAPRSSAMQSGWKAALDATKGDSKRFTNEFKFTDEAQLVKFLSSEPFAVYEQHWIERSGKRSFVCSADVDPKGCPLCDKGDSPRAKVAFSVLNLSAEEPVVEMLVTSPTLTRQLASLDSDAKTGPLDRLYWALSKTGTKKSTSYTVQAVKARDLDEDWGCDPNEIEELVEQFEPLTSDAIYRTPRSELIAIAREINS